MSKECQANSVANCTSKNLNMACCEKYGKFIKP